MRERRAEPLADNRVMPPETLKLLAIETSTDILSVAVGGRDPLAVFEGPGAARSSATLLPAVQELLQAAAWPLVSLDAVVFARGPGAFTGLRTACAVAQGLAYGARSGAHPEGLPVLPVDTLLALAETARHRREQAGQPVPAVIAALLDARMDEVYVALYRCDAQGVSSAPLRAPQLCAPADLAGFIRDALPDACEPGQVLLAGNVFEAYAPALAALAGERMHALPTAEALLRLAPGLLASGAAVEARDAWPLYVRDKVARTTAEREAV